MVRVGSTLTRSNKESCLATIIQQDRNALLIRLPGLETLTFADGTPFADDVTLNWIALRVTGGGSYHEPATMVNNSQSESDVLALETEVLEKTDAEGVDATGCNCGQVSAVLAINGYCAC